MSFPVISLRYCILQLSGMQITIVDSPASDPTYGHYDSFASDPVSPPNKSYICEQRVSLSCYFLCTLGGYPSIPQVNILHVHRNAWCEQGTRGPLLQLLPSVRDPYSSAAGGASIGALQAATANPLPEMPPSAWGRSSNLSG